jgi:7,8-dihydropterin-6-yl-methyl-4-(beta-D-ribofuranosyl)aminobenzene 5'-phosphate synthase
VLKKTNERCKLVVHPKAYGRKRFIRHQDGTYAGPWDMDTKVFDQFGSRIQPRPGPSDLGFGIYVSGEIEKKTDFEPRMPNAFVEVNGELVHDKIPDDQSIFIELEGKGIVVLTGCCHAGIVNTLTCAQKMFPGQRLYALVGGLHLNNANKMQMENTLDYIAMSNIRYLSALHCTGYHAKEMLMHVFSGVWVPGSVGAKICFTNMDDN